ncbi:MAG: DUF3137 domain-containing protein [Bacilli bacterium]|nr:DUF3137 domain-containing protein [Bacilli bacterium]
MTIEDLKQLQNEILNNIKKCNLIGRTILFIIFVIITILCLLIIKNIFIAVPIYIITTVIYLIIMSTIKHKKNATNIKHFHNEFKKIFVQSALSEVFDNLTYNHQDGISQDYMYEKGILTIGDIYTSNDYISGTYKSIKFDQSDVSIQIEVEVEDEEGNKTTEYETIFYGRYMIFDFNKKFKSNMVITNSHSSALSRGKLFNSQPITLEDQEFNKSFAVFAQNEHEAFYILTPHFMNKIKNISNKLRSGLIFFFDDNKLHIAINNYDDSFEPNLYEPIDEHKIKNAIKEDILLITDFVNDLALDNNLFK